MCPTIEPPVLGILFAVQRRDAGFWQGDFHNAGHEAAASGGFKEHIVSERLFDFTDGFGNL